ncbi:MAG TPA: biopolymer transporter ExbD [Gammaproteobacteria bacterium]|nr:biopolymer transporter ExbD [Gammaproteobacteria bacterium]
MKMSRRARRMSRHHQRHSRLVSINLVSLMDIFTILVFFLLVNSSDVQQVPSSKAVRLPESVAEQLPKETIVILVNQRDVVVQGRPVARVDEVMATQDSVIPGLLEELRYQAAKSRRVGPNGEPAQGEVTIMGDKQIPYRLLKKIMLTCTQADYTNISLAVVKKLNQEG